MITSEACRCSKALLRVPISLPSGIESSSQKATSRWSNVLFSTGEDKRGSGSSSLALFASSASPLFEFSASKSSLQSKAPSGLSLSSQSAIDSRSELSAYFLIAEYLRSEGMKFETGALHSLCCFFAVLGHSKTGRFVCCELVFRGGGNKINNPDGLD